MEFKGEFISYYQYHHHLLPRSTDQNNFSSFVSIPNANPNLFDIYHPDHQHSPNFLFMNYPPNQISIDPFETYLCYNNNPIHINGAAAEMWDQSPRQRFELQHHDQQHRDFLPSNFVSWSGAGGGGGGEEIKCNGSIMTQSDKSVTVNKKSNIIIKGQWTPQEDRFLEELVAQHGVKQWAAIANMMKGRLGKQCRERWHNHLRPDIKKDEWSEEEDRILIEAHKQIGNKWTEIAKRLTGRSENTVKNHWNATKRRQTFSRKFDQSSNQKSSLLHAYIKSVSNLSNNGNATSSREGSISSVVDNDQCEYYPLAQAPNFGNINDGNIIEPNYNFSRFYNLGSVSMDHGQVQTGGGSMVEFDIEFEKAYDRMK